MTNQEQWKPIQGYEGLYEVSSYGRIKSLPRIIKGKGQHYRQHKGRILKPITISAKLPYTRVDLCKEGKYAHTSIHRLVAETFIPNPENKPCVNHKDGIKSNNYIDNLEWCTYSENTRHAFALGLMKGSNAPMPCMQGAKHPMAIPIVQLNKDGTFVRSYDFMKAVIKKGFKYEPIHYAVTYSATGNSQGYRWMSKKDYENKIKSL